MQDRLRQLLRSWTLVLTAGLGGAAGAADAPIPVRIGHPQANYWPLYLARELKLYERVGLAPSFHAFTTGQPLIAGMKSGDLDVAYTGLASIFMLGNGIPLRFVMVALDHSSQVGLLVDPAGPVRSFRDLGRGRAIAAPSGTCAEVAAVLAARKAGVPAASLKLVNLAPNLLVGAMKNHQIDSAFIWSPWDIKLREAGFKLANLDRDYVPGGSVCGVTISVRPQVQQRHPALACRLIKAHALALEAARREPEAAVRVLEQALGLTREQARESFDGLVVPSLESQLDPRSRWSLAGADGLAQRLALAADALAARGTLPQTLDVETLRAAIDAGPLRQHLNGSCP